MTTKYKINTIAVAYNDRPVAELINRFGQVLSSYDCHHISFSLEDNYMFITCELPLDREEHIRYLLTK